VVEVIITSAPSCFKAEAEAKPIPKLEPAPVIKAFLPLRENTADTLVNSPLESLPKNL
jgi:hypothetical protein